MPLKRRAEGNQRPKDSHEDEIDIAVSTYRDIADSLGEYLQRINGRVTRRYIDGYFLGFWDEPDSTITLDFTANQQDSVIYTMMKNNSFNPSSRPRDDIISFTMEVCGYLAIYKPMPIPLKAYLEMLFPHFTNEEQEYLNTVMSKYNLEDEKDADILGKNLLSMYRIRFYSIYQRFRDVQAYAQSPKMALMRENEEALLNLTEKKDHLRLIRLLTRSSYEVMDKTVEESDEVFNAKDGTFTPQYIASIVSKNGSTQDIWGKLAINRVMKNLLENKEAEFIAESVDEDAKKQRMGFF